MTKDDARERVARGAALLDEQRPGWAHVINTGTLKMQYGCSCVLGQLEGSYEKATRRIWRLRGLIPTATQRPASDHGFYVRGNQFAKYTNYEYLLLQDAWIEAIADRLVPTSDKGTAVPAGATPLEIGITESA